MTIDGLEIKTTIFIIASMFLVANGMAQSNWSVQDVNFDREIVSPNTSTIQVLDIKADVTDTDYPPEGNLDPTPLKPKYLRNFNLTYNYNKTNGTTIDLSYWNDKWIAEIKPNLTKGGNILYSANGTIKSAYQEDIENSSQEANITESLEIGDYIIEHNIDESNFDESGRVKAGKEFEITVEAFNRSGSSLDPSNIEAELKFQNSTYSSDPVTVNNALEGKLVNSNVKFPNNPGNSYLMNLEVFNSSIGSDPNGTATRIINTAPAIDGQVSQFYSENGCSNESMVAECEQDANINMSYEITEAEAETVTTSLYAFNESGRHKLENLTLSQDGDTFTGELTLPDINTSKYKPKVGFQFNASNRFREHIDRKNVSLTPFIMDGRSSPNAYQGRDYQISVLFRKPYSLDLYNKSRFSNITANVTGSNSNNVGVLTENDMSFSQSEGYVQGDVSITEDDPTGSYELSIDAENIYGDNNSVESGFNVNSVDATFEAQTELELDIERYEPETFSIDIENLVNSDRNITYDVEEMEDELEILNTSIELNAEESDEILVEANLSDLEDQEGEILFQDNDTGYQQSSTIKIDTPECPLRNRNLCVKTESIDAEAIGDETFNRTIDLKNIGNSSKTVNYNVSIQDDISSVLTVESQNSESELEDEKSIDLMFNSTQAQDDLSGRVVINNSRDDENLVLPVALEYISVDNEQEINIESPQISLGTTSISLGTIVIGESETRQVEISNNGNFAVNSTTISSNQYTVIAESLEISSDDSETMNIQIEDINSNSGVIDITAENEGGTTTETITVTASPIQNYAERTSELNSRISELQTSAGSEYSSNLTNLRTRISEIETEWERGNYEEAESTYNEIDRSLTTLDAQTDTGGPPPQNQTNNQNSAGSVLPILIAVIIILLVVGFVFFESYIPEEGDPLYNVLGDKQ